MCIYSSFPLTLSQSRDHKSTFQYLVKESGPPQFQSSAANKSAITTGAKEEIRTRSILVHLQVCMTHIHLLMKRHEGSRAYLFSLLREEDKSRRQNQLTGKS